MRPGCVDHSRFVVFRWEMESADEDTRLPVPSGRVPSPLRGTAPGQPSASQCLGAGRPLVFPPGDGGRKRGAHVVSVRVHLVS